jgi:protein-tyrosine phosphatase
MAEFVMKDIVKKAGVEGLFEIASAAVSTEEIGNSVYPPAKRKMAEHGIRCDGKRARQVTRADYGYYDHLICMDRSNLRWLDRIIGSDPEGKVSLLLAHAGIHRDVADPWYTGDFDATWNDVMTGCTALLQELL